jgi:hypothetical protein
MTKQVQIDLREPKCPSCDALLEKTADVQQEEYVLLEMACIDCRKKYKETLIKIFETDE